MELHRLSRQSHDDIMLLLDDLDGIAETTERDMLAVAKRENDPWTTGNAEYWGRVRKVIRWIRSMVRNSME